MAPVIVNHTEKNHDTMKPCNSKHTLPVPWPFIISVPLQFDITIPYTVANFLEICSSRQSNMVYMYLYIMYR